MVAGYDFTVRGGAGQLFYVDSEGTCVEGDCFCVGSGLRRLKPLIIQVQLSYSRVS